LAACASDDEQAAATGTTATLPPATAGSSTGTGSGVTSSELGTGRPAGTVDQRPLAPTQLAQELAAVGDRVFFSFDQYDLDAEARATVEQQANLLRRSPTINVRLEGHCDERGTREYNLALGERRANAVKDYLVALGIAPTRLTTVSYGEERPAVIGSNETAWAQNRRGVTVVVGAAAGS
jgi:peptidoglycan-associated lipoprotein